MGPQLVLDTEYGSIPVKKGEVDMDSNPKTLSVPDAGRIYFGLCRNSSYEAARRGEIPTLRIGRKLVVPVVALERMLDQAANAPAS